jgi:hypothetical protein
MPYILIIDKIGTIKEMNIKEYKESDLFKKAGFKTTEGFLLQTVWDQPNSSISVYAKKNGKT